MAQFETIPELTLRKLREYDAQWLAAKQEITDMRMKVETMSTQIDGMLEYLKQVPRDQLRTNITLCPSEALAFYQANLVTYAEARRMFNLPPEPDKQGDK